MVFDQKTKKLKGQKAKGPKGQRAKRPMGQIAKGQKARNRTARFKEHK